MKTREARMRACDARTAQREITICPAVVDTTEHNGSALPKLMTVSEVKEASRLGITTIYKLIKSGELRSLRILGRRLVLVTSYLDLINRREAAERPANPSP
jgi:excisionase family DNA binding protein